MSRISEFRVRDRPSFIDHGSFAADYVFSEQFDFDFAIPMNPLVPAVFTESIDHAEHFDIRVGSVRAAPSRAIQSDGYDMTAIGIEQSRGDRVDHDKPLGAR
jgi:hypothetical protein